MNAGTAFFERWSLLIPWDHERTTEGPIGHRPAPLWMSRLCALLVLANAVVRVHATLAWNPLDHNFSDPARHFQNAVEPVTHNPMNGLDALGYQVWLGVMAKLTNGDRWAIGVYAALLSIITPWLWYRFFKEALGAPRVALWGGVVIGWLPSWLGIFSYFMTETLLLPLLGLSLWMTWYSLRRKTSASFFVAGTAWLAAVMTKQSVLPLAILAIAYLIWTHHDRWRKGLVLSVICASALVVAGYRTHGILGVFAPLGFGTINRTYFLSGADTIEMQVYRGEQGLGVWGFSSPSMHSKPLAPLSDWESSRRGIVSIRADIIGGSRDWDLALAKVHPTLGDRTRLQLENMVFLLWGSSWPDNNPDHFWESTTNAMRWMWFPLLLAVFSGNVVYVVRRRRVPLLMLFSIVGWTVLLLAPVSPAEGRYRKPFEGLLIANGLWLLTTLPPRKTDKLTA